LLVIAIVWSLLLCLLQLLRVLVQSVEALVPELLEPADPLVDRLQTARIEAVQPLFAGTANPYEPDLSEDPQMLGRLRLRHPEVARQGGHRPFAALQQHEDFPTLWCGDAVDRVRGLRCSCHHANHMPISECVKRSPSAYALCSRVHSEFTCCVQNDSVLGGTGPPARDPEQRRRRFSAADPRRGPCAPQPDPGFATG